MCTMLTWLRPCSSAALASVRSAPACGAAVAAVWGFTPAGLALLCVPVRAEPGRRTLSVDERLNSVMSVTGLDLDSMEIMINDNRSHLQYREIHRNPVAIA
ncbi:exported hypothetical protein [Paraburkholderia sacchari]